MDNIKVLVINDEGGDIRLEEEIISNSLVCSGYYSHKNLFPKRY
jgi:hypothetical protein